MDITALPGHPNYVVVEGEGLYRRDGDGVWAAEPPRVRHDGRGCRDRSYVGSDPTASDHRGLDSTLFVSEPVRSSQRMIDQVNLMRAQAGMTARLLGDAEDTAGRRRPPPATGR